MKKIYYIETNGFGRVTHKIEICEYEESKGFEGYLGELFFTNKEGQEKEYYNDITGDFDELSRFLLNGSVTDCEEYEYDVQDNIYLEGWLTDNVGYYENMYIGIMVE